jgi:hypothetical protein
MPTDKQTDLINSIDPQRLYSFAEAARLIPSPRGGKRTHIKTLHRWREDGQLKAVSRQAERLRYWYVYGAEILRLMGVCLPPPPQLDSPTERRRQHEADMKQLRAAGY